MSLARLYKYKELYITLMPLMSIYSIVIGIDTGVYVNNKIKSDQTFNDRYSNLIGYTSIGIITGITYPISYPLLGCYVLYKNHKS